MENRAAPENKRYTLTDEIIDTVIRLKDAAMEEMDRFDEYERMKMNHSGMSRFTAKMLVKRQNDRLFGTFKFPAEHALRAYLDTLTDDNLLDLALLYYMAETNDVTLSVEPGEPRFLDYYYGNEHLWYEYREALIDKVRKTLFSPMLQKARRMLSVPKDSDPEEMYICDYIVSKNCTP